MGSTEGKSHFILCRNSQIEYTTTDNAGMEYLRTTFRPVSVTIDGTEIPFTADKNKMHYTVRNLEGGDYAVTISRTKAGRVVITGN